MTKSIATIDVSTVAISLAGLIRFEKEFNNPELDGFQFNLFAVHGGIQGRWFCPNDTSGLLPVYRDTLPFVLLAGLDGPACNGLIESFILNGRQAFIDRSRAWM
jgi:hypothetical protein